jgi:polar amino acid transport system substrate-binding protein
MPAFKEEGEVFMLSRRLFAAGATGAPAILAGTAQTEDQPAEATIDWIKRTKVLRIAALPGEAPYLNKDIASGGWSGMCIEMAKDIAGMFEGQVEYLESTTAIRCSIFRPTRSI